MNAKDQNEIVKFLVNDENMQRAIIKGIKTSVIEVKEALVTPLMVNLFVFIYKEEQIIPQYVKDFYERLFDLVLRKHDNTKIDFEREVKSKLTSKQLHEAFRLLCCFCLKNEKITFDEFLFRKIIDKTIIKLELTCSIDELLSDIVSVLCFIVKEGHQYTFIHKSIAEYYAAEYIAYYGSPEKLYEDVDENYIKYRNVCRFLKYIDEYDYYIYFLKNKYISVLEVFNSKKFINNVYISFANNSAELMILFESNMHSYLTNDFREYIRDAFFEDLNNIKISSNINGVSLTIGRIYSDSDEEENLEKSNGFKLIHQDENYEYSRGVQEFKNENELLDSLRERGFTKISKLNMSNKYPNLNRQMNKYIKYLNDQVVEINKFIERNQINDDYALD